MTPNLVEQALPPFEEKQLHDGTIVREVAVASALWGERKMTFTQHRPSIFSKDGAADRYTVHGLTPNFALTISIQKRMWVRDVVMYRTLETYTLEPDDEWIAYYMHQGSYFGVLAVGATAQETYEKLFDAEGIFDCSRR